jgi:uncharacterized membrane protein
VASPEPYQLRPNLRAFFFLLGWVFVFGLMALIAALAHQRAAAYYFGFTAVVFLFVDSMILIIRPFNNSGWRWATYKADTATKRAALLVFTTVSLITVFLLIGREAGSTTAIIEFAALLAMAAVAAVVGWLRRRSRHSEQGGKANPG